MRRLYHTCEFGGQVKLLVGSKHKRTAPFIKEIEHGIRKLYVINFKPFKNQGDNAFLLQKKRTQKVRGAQRILTTFNREFVGTLQRLLRLDSKVVKRIIEWLHIHSIS